MTPHSLPQLPAPVRSYLDDPSLTPLWAAALKRLERNRLSPTGTVQAQLDAEGAKRLGGLLGTRLEPGLRRIQLGALDAALRASAAQCGLVSVVAELTGRPLQDRTSAKEAQQTAWTVLWQQLDADLTRAGLAHAGWIADWLGELRSTGILTRAGIEAAATALGSAVRTIAALTNTPLHALVGSGAEAVKQWELSELAAHTTGDAHGLDEGRLTGVLVLKAVAAACTLPSPDSAASRRLLWERVGVNTDSLSGTVMVWRLAPPGPHPWATMMRVRRDLALVTHLTLHELRTVPDVALTAPGTTVHFCENPQVLQAAARYGLPGILVCGSGNPSAAGWELLHRLTSGGADVAYHGDFDWPGVAIAERIMRIGARPWRMHTADYLSALTELPAEELLALAGSEGVTPWDPQLASTMAHRGLAVHEEAQLHRLLPDLRHDRSA
ncbi:TIGR02679 family protein [Streptomyces phaeochromogenes]|uniref:TIGR02679 family protein n=1 Tax=Streptomyces phaeochromogenes TaxID=1923 RepID=UPI002DDA85E5|nr:TIGR02679 family protein [Streptomyces phaeochromogenes]WRZ26258.1 TIGR02679 family protein [Streptomyces phaeochromogenes]